ncbi:MAG: hypothetical protein SFT81_04920 [Candidatus Caenarcaniphilales bacterium]|nr:hypothetical protein [Candidatus Caenarcaniphilales bacterium]
MVSAINHHPEKSKAPKFSSKNTKEFARKIVIPQWLDKLLPTSEKVERGDHWLWKEKQDPISKVDQLGQRWNAFGHYINMLPSLFTFFLVTLFTSRALDKAVIGAAGMFSFQMVGAIINFLSYFVLNEGIMKFVDHNYEKPWLKRWFPKNLPLREGRDWFKQIVGKFLNIQIWVFIMPWFLASFKNWVDKLIVKIPFLHKKNENEDDQIKSSQSSEADKKQLTISAPNPIALAAGLVTPLLLGVILGVRHRRSGNLTERAKEMKPWYREIIRLNPKTGADYFDLLQTTEPGIFMPLSWGISVLSDIASSHKSVGQALHDSMYFAGIQAANLFSHITRVYMKPAIVNWFGDTRFIRRNGQEHEMTALLKDPEQKGAVHTIIFNALQFVESATYAPILSWVAAQWFKDWFDKRKHLSTEDLPESVLLKSNGLTNAKAS